MTTQHNKSVDAIRAMALQTGACKKINRVQDFPELIITLKGKEYVCLVGDTKATIEASGAKFTHTIILMHGARAQINAKDYAVLNIVNISGEYSVNKDGTVVVL